MPAPPGMMSYVLESQEQSWGGEFSGWRIWQSWSGLWAQSPSAQGAQRGCTAQMRGERDKAAHMYLVTLCSGFPGTCKFNSPPQCHSPTALRSLSASPRVLSMVTVTPPPRSMSDTPITCVVTGFFAFVEAGIQNLSSLTKNLGHTPPAGEVQSLNHWTDREVPVTSFISILVTISEHPLCSKCWLKHHTNMREVPLLVSLLRLRSFSSEKLGAWHKITQPVQSGARASHLSIRFPAWKRMVTPTLSLYDGRAGVRIWVGKDPSLGLWDLSPNPPEWAWEKWFYLENSSFRITRWKFVRREAM